MTLAEATPGAGPAFVWGDPVWTGDSVTAGDEGTAVVTIGAATDIAVQLENTAVPLTGSLTLTKLLSGAGAASVSATTVFPFTATGTDLLGESHEVALSVTAGTPAVIDDLPLGTQVRITEGQADLSGKVRWEGVTWNTDDDTVAVSPDGTGVVITVTGEQGAGVGLTATNAFAVVPDLPSTGGTFGPTLLVAALVMLAVGVGAVWRSRRRSALSD